MTLETLTTQVQAKTGLTGKDLTVAVLFTAMLLADLKGNKKAAEHFQTRINALVT